MIAPTQGAWQPQLIMSRMSTLNRGERRKRREKSSLRTLRSLRLRAVFLTAGALGLAIGVPIAIVAQSDRSWREPFEPVRIAANVYYVGTRGLSSFLIVTPAGHVVIDSGEAESVPFIRANVEKLGFRMSDVRLLLAGHAHFDHVGGHADMNRLTAAQVVAMDADREALESGVDRSALGP